MKLIIKLLIYTSFLLSVTFIFSQSSHLNGIISVQTTVVPPYKVSLDSYTNTLDNLIVTISSGTQNVLDMRFEATITGDNGIIWRSNQNTPPEPFRVNFLEPKTVSGLDVEQLGIVFNKSNIDISNTSAQISQQVLENEILPQGNYDFCIRAYDYSGEQAYSNESTEGCGAFEIEAPIINVQTMVIPPYKIRLDEYTNELENVTVTIGNNVSQQESVTTSLRFEALLTGDNGFVWQSNQDQEPLEFILNPNENRTLSGAEINELGLFFDVNTINTNGLPVAIRQQIIENRVLPEGNYTLCVKAYDYNTGSLVSDDSEVCGNFDVFFPERPILLSPANDEVVMANTINNINFAWSQPVTISPDIIGRLKYELKVVQLDLYPNMDPTELIIARKRYYRKHFFLNRRFF